jgi:2-polyprenyl-6-methoxyphenol hydroxylase-like FAD-dependent oxidoreductase
MSIAIVGAGPSGLTLARILHVHGVEATVYERDGSPTARTQGGTLDLTDAGGQFALRAAGLEAEFRAEARPEGQDLILLDRTGTVLLREDTPDDAPPGRPEIDRPALRRILLDSLPPDTVHWGHTLERARRIDTGFELRFTNGATAECALLVGADGARSKVRPLLTDAELTYAGTTYRERVVPDIDRRYPEMGAMVGRGTYWVVGEEGMRLSAQRNGDGSVHVYVSSNGSADFTGWAPEILALWDIGEDTGTELPTMTLPVGLTWPATAGVTLIGDAAHLMPATGEGANQAMRDAADLAAVIAANPDNPAIRDYETAMFDRTARVARKSRANLEMLKSGPQAVLRMMQSLGSPA